MPKLMKLKFKDQKFQENACNSVCDVFAGQPKQSGVSYMIDKGVGKVGEFDWDDFTGYKNAKIVLDDNSILQNMRLIQNRNNIKPSELLDGKYNITVEMETGTGKTYTYIKTIYELNKRYGWSKFIVIVPSIAIREGVAKSFEIMKDHFMLSYGQQIKWFIYNSSRLNEIEHFASDSGINIMIINSQAFNATGKDARKIDQPLDEFRSRKPIDVIAKTNPILIIDEPQSVEGAKTVEGLKKFNALFTLRYSATHKKAYNMVYRLDAVDAYNQKLVKKIEVKGISVSGITGTNGYLYLQRINVYPNKNPDALLEFHIKGKSGLMLKKQIVSEGFDLYQQSGNLEEYKGYKLTTIDARNGGFIEFSNGIKLEEGEIIYGDNTSNDNVDDQLRRIQIRETIASHLDKEHFLFYKGIKVLSLFFIDSVVKYKDYEKEDQKGVYAKIFEEEYENAVNDYIGELGEGEYVDYLKSQLATKVHAGYFSQDKQHHFIDSDVKKKEGGSDDVSAYDLIMKDKERLLSFEEPVRFIFSHSALKEGWDNPNVFQICTLRDRGENAEIRKRQEIGRGLRLCVNQNGDRQDEPLLGSEVHNVNVLTVIANESYKDFSAGLQKEISELMIDRPTVVTIKLFENAEVSNDKGEKHLFTEEEARIIYNSMVRNDYIDDSGKLTDKYYQDKDNKNVKIPEQFTEFSNPIISLIDSIWDEKKLLPENARNNGCFAKLNKDMFNKKEFQDLWKKINIKSIYKVNFNSDELIEKSIKSLNANLRINTIKVNVSTGYLGDKSGRLNVDSLSKGSAFTEKVNSTSTHDLSAASINTEYDLLEEICEDTGLTRTTIAKILKGINKVVFDQFNNNPADFIIKAGKLINDELATLIIDHIVYEPLEETYSSEIFTAPSLKCQLGIDSMETVKNVFNYLRYDSTVEKDFANELEKASNVVVYAKLPKSFYIPTPIGHYNPDWAIVLTEDNVKHIYFIAETKGTMQDLQLTPLAKVNKQCAIAHFDAISNGEIKHEIVKDYKSLMEKVMK